MIEEKYNLLILIGLFWAIIIISGVSINNTSNQDQVKPNWQVSKPLHINHRITGTDIKKPEGLRLAVAMPDKDELLGRYLVIKKNTGDFVSDNEVSSTPIVNASPTGMDNQLVIYSLSEKEQPILNIAEVGRKIKLCITKSEKTNAGSKLVAKCFNKTLDIVAAGKNIEKSVDNWLLLSCPAGSIAELTRYMTNDKRLLVVIPMENS